MRITERSKLDSMLRSQTVANQRLDKATRVASSGQRVSVPSDDPVAYGTMVRRDYALAMLDQHASTAAQAKSELEVVSNSLDSATDLMLKVQETALSGANTSTDANSRKLLAEDVRNMRDELMSIANTRYGNKYLFSGSKTDTAPFDTTNGQFVGNDQVIRVPVLDGVTPPANISGARTFTATGGRDIFSDLTNLADALDANDDAKIRIALPTIQDGYQQIVRSQVEAGVAAERFTNAAEVLVQTKSAVTERLSAEIDGDPTQQLTELTLARTAYERNVAVTKELLSINTQGV